MRVAPSVARATRSHELNMLQWNLLRLGVCIPRRTRACFVLVKRLARLWRPTRIPLPREELLDGEQWLLLCVRGHCHLDLVRHWLWRVLRRALLLVLRARETCLEV